MSWDVIPVGESAVVVRFGEQVDIDLNRRVLAADRAIEDAGVAGVIELVPAIGTLMIRYDPTAIDTPTLTGELSRVIGAPHQDVERRVFELPVRYGGSDGPDLERVAEMRGCDSDTVIADHLRLELSVLMIGFAPGFAYCGVADDSWDIPRSTSITPEVPAGSILVAVRQTAIAGTAIPTGWHCIGRTTSQLFDPLADPPAVLAPGTPIRFVREEVGHA